MNLFRWIEKGGRFLLDRNYRFTICDRYSMFDRMSDRKYLERKFEAYMGYKPNLDAPQTFNEKLQWLKLYDRKPLYTRLVDKYRVREYVKEKIGEQYLIPLLGVWDSPEEIDFDALPERFVLKCNHSSGANALHICKDKSTLDVEAVKAKLAKGMKRDFFLFGREWPYKNVPRKIIAEQFVEDSTSGELRDYKIMCFGSDAKCSFVCSDRFTKRGLHVTFFDRDWKIMPFERGFPSRRAGFKKPQNYNEMLRLAEILSENIPFVRVDFYEVDGKVYFGELTFFPGNGMEKFSPEEWDYTLGSWIQLPEKTC